MQGPDGLRRGQRQAEREGIEAPQGSDDRRKRGHETLALKLARQPQQQGVILPHAAHRHGQPPNQKEQGEVEHTVAVQSGGEPAPPPAPSFHSLSQNQPADIYRMLSPFHCYFRASAIHSSLRYGALLFRTIVSRAAKQRLALGKQDG